MDEQRFTVFRDEYNKSKGVYDSITQRRIYQWGHITRLLNIFNNRYIRRVSELKKENEELKETLAFRSNQLALMERLVDDLGSEEMARQMEEILNG